MMECSGAFYGLSNEAAQARLRLYGPNALHERPPTPLWRRFARQFQSPLILSAVEALGSVTVIATDKTGTLTENRMFVRDLDSPDVERALRAMALANDAEEAAGAGDPLELALLEYARRRGVEPDFILG